MTTRAQPYVVPEAQARQWVAAFERDPLLTTQFPLQLVNGSTVPGIHLGCSGCGDRIANDRIHGLVTRPLPHVVTVAANEYCEACDRMTHIDCRFRVQAGKAVVEWLDGNGWQAKVMRLPTLLERIIHAARRLKARIAPAM